MIRGQLGYDPAGLTYFARLYDEAPMEATGAAEPTAPAEDAGTRDPDADGAQLPAPAAERAAGPVP